MGISKKGITQQIMVRVGSVVLLSLLAVTCVAVCIAYQFSKKQVTDQSRMLAQKFADEVSVRLNDGATATRTLARSFEGMIEGGSPSRVDGNAVMRRVLETNPNIISAWAVFEPNAFDGRDSRYVNTQYGNDSGRYAMGLDSSLGYISTAASAESELVPGDGDYYLIPRDTGRETICEPYLYSYHQGTPEVYETSYAVPVKLHGRIIGVVGVDITLGQLTALVSKIRPYEGSCAALITNAGVYAAHHNAALRGKDIGNSDSARRAKSAVAAGELRQVNTYDKTLRSTMWTIYAPVEIGKSVTPWSLAVSIPAKQAMTPVRKLALTCLLVDFVLTALALGILYSISRQIARPIRALANVAKQLADGDIESAGRSLKGFQAEQQRTHSRAA